MASFQAHRIVSGNIQRKEYNPKGYDSPTYTIEINVIDDNNNNYEIVLYSNKLIELEHLPNCIIQNK